MLSMFWTFWCFLLWSLSFDIRQTSGIFASSPSYVINFFVFLHCISLATSDSCIRNLRLRTPTLHCEHPCQSCAAAVGVTLTPHVNSVQTRHVPNNRRDLWSNVSEWYAVQFFTDFVYLAGCTSTNPAFSSTILWTPWLSYTPGAFITSVKTLFHPDLTALTLHNQMCSFFFKCRELLNIFEISDVQLSRLADWILRTQLLLLSFVTLSTVCVRIWLLSSPYSWLHRGRLAADTRRKSWPTCSANMCFFHLNLMRHVSIRRIYSNRQRLVLLWKERNLEVSCPQNSRHDNLFFKRQWSIMTPLIGNMSNISYVSKIVNLFELPLKLCAICSHSLLSWMSCKRLSSLTSNAIRLPCFSKNTVNVCCIIPLFVECIPRALLSFSADHDVDFVLRAFALTAELCRHDPHGRQSLRIVMIRLSSYERRYFLKLKQGYRVLDDTFSL